MQIHLSVYMKSINLTNVNLGRVKRDKKNIRGKYEYILEAEKYMF